MDGKGNTMGGGKFPCIGNVLLGGGTSVHVVWIVIVVYVGGDDKYGGGKTYKLPKVYHVEEGPEKHIRNVGNTDVQRGVEGRCNSYIGHISWL